MAVSQEAQVRQMLGLPDTHALAALVPLGRPTRQLTKLRRRTVEETVTHERFDGAPFTPPNTPDDTASTHCNGSAAPITPGAPPPPFLAARGHAPVRS
jgi:hypothetical protein